MERIFSTTKASQKLSEDLGVDYGLGRNVVSHFFDLVLENNGTSYWEPKSNYLQLVAQNENVNDLKDRIKEEVRKIWGKNIEEIIPEKDLRRKLYIEAFKSKKNPARRMLKADLVKFLMKKIDHYK